MDHQYTSGKTGGGEMVLWLKVTLDYIQYPSSSLGQSLNSYLFGMRMVQLHASETSTFSLRT